MAEHVLLVDDEKDFLDIMKERLSARGIAVSTETSPEKALKRIESELFDALILDLQMPGIDGLEALKRAKKLRPELQVILLTGHATVEKGVEAIKLGAMDFIEKPADLEALSEKIKRARQNKMLIVEKMNQEKIVEMLRRFGL
ncbi:MAG: response regulator [Desulfobacterales bacterium]|nr:response regulator [Desulfobacterales bacterium]MCF8078691.1 response regulator [Desulfobacterales bacterium]